MSESWNVSLAEVSDEQLRAALEEAHVPALLCTLAHLTGSGAHFAEIKPFYDPFAEDEDGLSEADRVRARSLAFDALAQWRRRACPPLAPLPEDTVREAMRHITGEPFDPSLHTFLREELDLYAEDGRRIDISADAIPDDFRVLIIGAGMSGIGMAVRLKQQGIPFLILEKNPQMSGTWYENTYPGCQVDSANHLYSYMFAPNSQWSSHFSGAAELRAYFLGVVEEYGLREHTRLNCEVRSADYDSDRHRWQVVAEQNGETVRFAAPVLVSAVGQLNRPRLPEIPGMGRFAGIAFHSARWEHRHRLAGKRVAVIGSGCSAVQFVPEIAPQCASLTVFQRTPCWLYPAPEYHLPMSEAQLWLFRELPYYARWYRFFLFRTRAVDGFLPMMRAEPGWSGADGTVSRTNALLREALIEYAREQAQGDEALLAKLIPDYPPGGKRPVLDDGSWVRALRRDNVHLCVDGIREIVPKGLVTEDGRLHPVDVLIFGTGFEADQFLMPMQVRGANGVDLVSRWSGDPRAYKGVLVSGYPNFYCLYGPNTNIVVGSSIVFYVECQIRFVMGCIKLQLEQALPTIECRAELQADYNRSIDALNAQRAWGSPLVDSWYKNASGRVTQNWPGTHFEFWDQTRSPALEELRLVFA